MFGQLLYHYTQHYYIDEEQVIYNTLLQGAIWFVVLIILCVLLRLPARFFWRWRCIKMRNPVAMPILACGGY